MLTIFTNFGLKQMCTLELKQNFAHPPQISGTAWNRPALSAITDESNLLSSQSFSGKSSTIRNITELCSLSETHMHGKSCL